MGWTDSRSTAEGLGVKCTAWHWYTYIFTYVHAFIHIKCVTFSYGWASFVTLSWQQHEFLKSRDFLFSTSCKLAFKGESWHFYLQDPVADEKKTRKFGCGRGRRMRGSGEVTGAGGTALREADPTVYLFALLIFWKSRLGFCARLHPAETNIVQVNYRQRQRWRWRRIRPNPAPSAALWKDNDQ